VIFAKRMPAPSACAPPVSMLERIAAMPPIDVSGDLLETMKKAAAKKVSTVRDKGLISEGLGSSDAAAKAWLESR
jgi:hypothetical protein